MKKLKISQKFIKNVYFLTFQKTPQKWGPQKTLLFDLF
jgi:hypothetical protein